MASTPAKWSSSCSWSMMSIDGCCAGVDGKDLMSVLGEARNQVPSDKSSRSRDSYAHLGLSLSSSLSVSVSVPQRWQLADKFSQHPRNRLHVILLHRPPDG